MQHRTPSHQFGKVIPKFVYSWHKKYKRFVKPKVSIPSDDFDQMVNDIKDFIPHLFGALASHYKGLEDATPNVVSISEILISDLIFDQIYTDVFTMFKKHVSISSSINHSSHIMF